MIYKFKRNFKLTTILLVIGFTISMMSVLIGISMINSILFSLSENTSDMPIFLTMQNTGLSLVLSIYLFSISNCFVVSNYWIVTKRREIAIFKSFGWSNYRLIYSIVSEMTIILLISLCISLFMIIVFSELTSDIISIDITPFLFCSTICFLLFTLVLSVIIPVIRIFQIRPVEVIS